MKPTEVQTSLEGAALKLNQAEAFIRHAKDLEALRRVLAMVNDLRQEYSGQNEAAGT